MTSSGTVATTTMTVDRFLAHAGKLAGFQTGELVGETADLAIENLFMMLSALANQGIPLWTHSKVLLGTVPNQINYSLPVGTVDVTNCLWRTPSIVTTTGVGAFSSAGGVAANAFDQNTNTACIQSATNGFIGYNFGSQTTIISAGIMPNGTATYTLAFEVSQDNITWQTIYTVPPTVYFDQNFVWFDFDTLAITAQYFRVRETGGGTLNLREVAFCDTLESEIPMARLNVDEYTSLTSKHTNSTQTLQYYVQRLVDIPLMKVWPPTTSYFNVIVAWQYRHIEDPGGLQNTLELPLRWYNAIKYKLAVELALENPEKLDVQKFALLQGVAEQALRYAWAEERDNSPIYLTPNISAYTR